MKNPLLINTGQSGSDLQRGGSRPKKGLPVPITEPQRGSVTQPRVAKNELPWVPATCIQKWNPNGILSFSPGLARSSCLAGLPWVHVPKKSSPSPIPNGRGARGEGIFCLHFFA